jgi:hypothetical protein
MMVYEIPLHFLSKHRKHAIPLQLCNFHQAFQHGFRFAAFHLAGSLSTTFRFDSKCIYITRPLKQRKVSLVPVG